MLSLCDNGIGPDLPSGLVLLLTTGDGEAQKDGLAIPACTLQKLCLDRNAIETIPIRLGAY